MAMTVPNNAPVAPTPANTQSMYPTNRNYLSDFNPMMRNTGLPGYFIQNESEIVPKNIPMDGSISFFPYKDLSKIVIKQWDANGINTLSYVIEQPAMAHVSPDQSTEDKLPLTPPDLSANTQQNPIMDTLQAINTGLSTTFGQVGTTLQAIQQEVNQLNTMVNSILNGDLGGRG